MKKRIPTVRRLFAGAATTALMAAMAAVFLATPAGATITTPSNGAALTGVASFNATGTANTGSCGVLDLTPSTVLQLENSSGTVLDSDSTSTAFLSESASPASFTYPTYEQPNGTYKVVDTEKYYTGTFCSHDTNTYTNTVTFANSSTVTYTGPTSASPGQTITVSAVLGLSGISTPAGQTVTFSLSGQSSVSAATNSSGVASTTLTVTGSPRNATITAAWNGGYFDYPASSTAPAFVVTPDPTNVSLVASTTTPAYGQSDTFTASVNSTAFGTNPNGTPTGNVQFQVGGVNYGSAVGLTAGAASITDPEIGNAAAYTIKAVYSGDTNYSGNSASIGVTVSAALTSTTLAANPASTLFGQSVDFTATVATQPPGAGTPTGTVTFQINGSPFGNPVGLNGSGQATSQSISTLGANGYTITAIFNGSTDFAGSSTSVSYTVGKAASSTSEATSASPFAVYGQGITFTATVGDNSPNSTGTPTGSVDFQFEGASPGTTSQGSFSDLGAGALNGNTASSPSISTLNPGVYTVEAIYGGDSNFTGSSATISQVVTPDTTTTSLSSTVPTSVYGQPVSVTASVSANPPGAGNPTGQVDFQIVNNAPGSLATDLGDVTLSGGSAGIALPNEPAGSYTVTATYEGSPLADFQGSNTTLLQTVNPDPTTTAVTTSVSPSVSGQTVTFTAIVAANSPGAGTPTGSITFADGSTPLSTVNLAVVGGSDQATLTTSALSVGTHAITATYSGDDNFVTSNDSLTQTVNQDPSTTTITQNGGTEPGQAVSFTATVTANPPGSGIPTGTVTFELSGAPIGGPVALSAGVATSESLSDLTPGYYTITAIYSGDTDFLTSTGTVTQPVGLAATTTSLVASPNPSTFSEAVTLTATVSVVAPGSGNPTGTVDFFNGPNLLGSALLSGGQAAITTSSLAIGAYSLTASYVGDADFLPSQSSAISDTVEGITTTTNLASSLNPSDYGQSVTLTATVAPQAAGPNPTGTVTFSDGSTPIGTAPLQNTGGVFTASITSSTLSVGGHSITASYSGDSVHDGSATAAALVQTVNQTPTSITADTEGTGGILTAVLTTAQGPLANQTLVFTTGTTQLCTAVTDATGTASCTIGLAKQIAVRSAGSYKVTYVATTDYGGSTATGAS
ncbi:MAG TPA: Ig-like domain-containing protein [Acidimicrobiales bacterium]|jgi:hypothetical protein